MDEDLAEDPLFLACTRPAMIAGVTMEAMGLNAMATMTAFLATGSVASVGLGVVCHLIFRQIVRLDHNAFRTWAAWAHTRTRCRNAGFWRGSTVTPLPLGRAYTQEDFHHG